MPNASASALEVASGLVFREIPLADTSEQVALGAERVCERLYSHLGRWIGLDGCAALMERALVEARAEHPWLGPVRSHPRLLPHLAGLDTCVEGRSAAEVMAAVTSILAAFMMLLGEVIGLPLAVRLVEDAWKPSAPQPHEPEQSRDEH